MYCHLKRLDSFVHCVAGVLHGIQLLRVNASSELSCKSINESFSWKVRRILSCGLYKRRRDCRNARFHTAIRLKCFAQTFIWTKCDANNEKKRRIWIAKVNPFHRRRLAYTVSGKPVGERDGDSGKGVNSFSCPMAPRCSQPQVPAGLLRPSLCKEHLATVTLETFRALNSTA